MNETVTAKGHNPLIVPILEILREAEASISEHELLKRLDATFTGVEGLSSSVQLGLFQRHFMVMNALYQLQAELLEEGYALEISALAIGLRKVCTDDVDNTSLSIDAGLASYYLDWAHFEGADEASVEKLLTSFWERFYAQDKLQEAYQTLDVTPDAEWPSIKKQYRRLAAALHPDRGGDSAAFMALREAYEVLLAAKS